MSRKHGHYYNLIRLIERQDYLSFEKEIIKFELNHTNYVDLHLLWRLYIRLTKNKTAIKELKVIHFENMLRFLYSCCCTFHGDVIYNFCDRGQPTISFTIDEFFNLIDTLLLEIQSGPIHYYYTALLILMSEYNASSQANKEMRRSTSTYMKKLIIKRKSDFLTLSEVIDHYRNTELVGEHNSFMIIEKLTRLSDIDVQNLRSNCDTLF